MDETAELEEKSLAEYKIEVMQRLFAELAGNQGVQSIHSIVAVEKPNTTRFIVNLDDLNQTPIIPNDLFNRLQIVPVDVTYIGGLAKPPTGSQKIYQREQI